LGAGGPAFTAIQQGRVAACLALKIIDHTPVVDVNNEKDKKTLEGVRGQIVFENVNFTYPTRQDL
jgi:hypothetical protein